MANKIDSIIADLNRITTYVEEEVEKVLEHLYEIREEVERAERVAKALKNEEPDDSLSCDSAPRFSSQAAVRIKNIDWVLENCHQDRREVKGKLSEVYIFRDDPIPLTGEQLMVLGKRAVIEKVEDEFRPFNHFFYKYLLSFSDADLSMMYGDVYFPEWILDVEDPQAADKTFHFIDTCPISQEQC